MHCIQIDILETLQNSNRGFNVKVKVKWFRYRPGVAQRVGRSIALLFHDRGTRKGWVVSSTPWPHFTPGKDTVPILQEGRWAPGPVWTDGISRPHRDSIPDRLARSSVAIPTELPGPHILYYIFAYISYERCHPVEAGFVYSNNCVSNKRCRHWIREMCTRAPSVSIPILVNNPNLKRTSARAAASSLPK